MLKKDAFLGERYYNVRHKSGLDIYLFPKDIIMPYAILGAKYGAADNGIACVKGKEIKTYPDGIAHFLEHKLFANEDGTDSFEIFSKLGAEANAYTDYDATAYLFGGSPNFSKCLSELIKFVTNPYFTEESVAREIGIISEEINMYGDLPHDRCHHLMLCNMFSQRGIRTDICGSVESIRKITPGMLYECHRTFYHPSNLVLVVCGRVRLSAILEICDRLLPESAPLPVVRKNTAVDEPREVLSRYGELKMQVSRPIFSIGTKDTVIPLTPAERLKRHLCVSLVNQLLFSGSGELFELLFEKNLLSDPLFYSYTTNENFAFITLSGESDDPEALFCEIKSYLEKIKLEGFAESDFEICRRVALANFVKNFDSAENIANLLFSYVCDGSDLFWVVPLINQITLSDANALVRSLFSEEKMTLAAVKPN